MNLELVSISAGTWEDPALRFIQSTCKVVPLSLLNLL